MNLCALVVRCVRQSRRGVVASESSYVYTQVRGTDRPAPTPFAWHGLVRVSRNRCRCRPRFAPGDTASESTFPSRRVSMQVAVSLGSHGKRTRPFLRHLLEMVVVM